MKRITTGTAISGMLAIAGAAVLCISTVRPVTAQDVLGPSAIVYSATGPQSGYIIGSWGSGTAKPSTDVKWRNGNTVEINSRDMSAGGRIDLKTPVDVTSAFSDPNGYLELTAKFGTASSQGTGGMRPGGAARSAGRPAAMARPGMGAGPVGMMGTRGGTRAAGMGVGSAPRGMAGPAGMAGGPARMQNPAGMGARFSDNRTGLQAGGKVSPPSDVRVTLQFDNGTTAECTLPRAYFGQSSDGWMSLSCPLSVLKAQSDQDTYKIKRVIITGDGTQPFYVADLRTVTDSTTIQAVSAGSDKEVARNDKVSFRASCTPGMTAVRYSWDFDASNGIQNEAEGPAVLHKFTESGSFIVTVTAYDVFGVKSPATATCKVHVNL